MNDTAQRAPTLGEFRVRLTFNPSGNAKVNQIKTETAAMLDFLEGERDRAMTMPAHDDRDIQKRGEIVRCLSLAMTHYEDAAMWAVKAVTG